MESTDKAIEALEMVRQSTDEIKDKLEPFLKRRHDERSATCNSAIALALGTLCFMGSRVRGKKPNEELRCQLNQIRSLLKQAQKQEKEKVVLAEEQRNAHRIKQAVTEETNTKGENEKRESSKRTPETNKTGNESSRKKQKNKKR